MRLPVGQEAEEGRESERGGGQSDRGSARLVLHAGQSADVSCHADAARLSGHAGLKLRPQLSAFSTSVGFFFLFVVVALSFCRWWFFLFVLFVCFPVCFKTKAKCFR